jgi:hypothetical protein
MKTPCRFYRWNYDIKSGFSEFKALRDVIEIPSCKYVFMPCYVVLCYYYESINGFNMGRFRYIIKYRIGGAVYAVRYKMPYTPSKSHDACFRKFG